ncbi:MAG: taxon MazF [Mucilaginibacter sp.]|jgi:mRNA interferase MazF|nr:taxon MazF [Mucilaginibacter sp.]
MIKDYPAQHEIWVADLDPPIGSEPGKVRPIVILQTDSLNKIGHGTFVACAISSQHKEGVSLIRLPVKPTDFNGLLRNSYILCDQIRSIDVQRLKGRIGILDKETIQRLNESIKAILSL